MSKSSNFDNPYGANVIGLWDFLKGSETLDTGLDDGFAQDGVKTGPGAFANGRYITESGKTRFDVEGNDVPFQLDSGTLITQFQQTGNPKSDPFTTVVSRGEVSGAENEGYFEVRVTSDGAVEVFHKDGTPESTLTSGDGFLDKNDHVRVTYSWDALTGNSVLIENLSDGTQFTASSDITGLSFDLTDAENASFTISASEIDEGVYGSNFSGKIDYVAVLDAPVLLRDGIVEGSDNAELIDIDYDGDPQGDRIDNGDAILPGQGPDDDIVEALGGDDTILSGKGDDTVFAGAGSDTVEGGTGNDILFGDSSLSGKDPVSERSVFKWSDAPGFADEADASGFTQNTGKVDVTFAIEGATTNSEVEYETARSNVSGIDNGTLGPVNPRSNLALESTSSPDTASITLDFSEPVTDISFRINDIDFTSSVTVYAIDDRENLVPVDLTEADNITLSDTDTVAGADTATSNGGGGAPSNGTYSTLVSIAGPVVQLTIVHNNIGASDSDVHITDVYFSTPVDADDVLDGGVGNDIIFGEIGEDIITGGAGNDLINGGKGADSLFGEADRDTFFNITAGDFVDGGEAFTTDPGDDFDRLDLRGSAKNENPNGSLKVEFDPANSENGIVTYFDENGQATGTVEFFNIEKVIPCFTPGTRIATPHGERLVETLEIGDRVITRDNGIQEVCWVGKRQLAGAGLPKHLWPVRIAKGALGNGLPERDMMVSPNHRVLISTDKTALYFEESEVLVAAKHLVERDGIETVNVDEVTYIHFMFARHEVVLSDGAWTESFQPGDLSLKGIGDAQRAEIFEIFPELETQSGISAYQSARRSLKKHEALLLMH
ncbi:MAG: Hint domain-containing protein [Arenibacterium sp.]